MAFNVKGRLNQVGDVVTLTTVESGSALQIDDKTPFVGTVVFEGTTDGTTWSAINGMPAAGGAAVSQTTTAGLWQFDTSGLGGIRARMTAYTSGSAGVHGFNRGQAAARPGISAQRFTVAYAGAESVAQSNTVLVPFGLNTAGTARDWTHAEGSPTVDLDRYMVFHNDEAAGGINVYGMIIPKTGTIAGAVASTGALYTFAPQIASPMIFIPAGYMMATAAGSSKSTTLTALTLLLA